MADPNGGPVDVANDNVGDVRCSGDLTGSPNQQLLATALDITGTNVGIVAFKRSDQVSQGELISGQTLGVRGDLVFLREATDGVDLGHAWNIAQLRFDDPILDYPQVGGRVWRAVLLQRPLSSLDRPQEDLTQSCRDWTHDCLCSFWQLFAGNLQALIDELAGKVEIRAVFEDYGHLRQTRAR